MSPHYSSQPLLSVQKLNVYHGQMHILQDVSLSIYPGELVCLLGGQASGKSTLLKTILGIVTPASGSICFVDEDLLSLSTEERIARGIAVVPENRRVFGGMTVSENLLMGAYLRRDKNGIRQDRERVLMLFPRLISRLHQPAATLDSREQKMLAMARALMSHPQLLLMDAPSLGLSPALAAQHFDLIQHINEQGTTIFMVEQNAHRALSIADRGYVLQTGRVALADAATNLVNHAGLRAAYLGGAVELARV